MTALTQTDSWGREYGFKATSALDAGDPAVAALIGSLERRIDALNARVIGLEAANPGVRVESVPFEIATYGWVRRLAAVVADEWGVSGADLIGQRRGGEIIRPRFVLIWLMRHCSPMSLPQIGRLVGNRDHTTVMHALKRVDAWRTQDEVMRHITDSMLIIANRLRAEHRQALTAAPETNTPMENGE